MIVADFEELFYTLAQMIMTSNEEDDIRGRIVCKHVSAEVIAPRFMLHDFVEKVARLIPIDVRHKIKYIEETYYQGLLDQYKSAGRIRFAETKLFWQPTKHNPCIAYLGLSRVNGPKDGNELTVVFRASRLFPVFFLDLLTIENLATRLNLERVNFYIDTLFLQRETILLDLLYPNEKKGKLFKRSVEIWKNQVSRPDSDIKFGQTKKLKKFYQSLKGNEE